MSGEEYTTVEIVDNMSGEYTAVEIVDNMSGEYTTSLHRRRKNDRKTGLSGFDDEEDDLGPIDIFRTMCASVDRLRRWRQAALVLSAYRRYCYTLDLKKEEEKKQIIAKIRTHAQLIAAARLFQVAAQQVSAAAVKLPAPVRVPLGDHGSGTEQLWSMTRDHDFSALQNYGGVKGLADTLKTSLDKGIIGDDADILERKNIYGSNTYPRNKSRSFWLQPLLLLWA